MFRYATKVAKEGEREGCPISAFRKAVYPDASSLNATIFFLLNFISYIQLNTQEKKGNLLVIQHWLIALW